MIYFCVIAVFVVYYVSYALMSKKTKFSYAIAFVPTIMIGGIFWWLISYRYLTALMFVLYGLGAVVVIGYTIVFIRKKPLIVSLLSMIPAILSLLLLCWFINVNFLNQNTCEVSDGCMNETGLIMWFSLALMIIAFIITLFTFIFDKFLTGNRPVS